MSIQEEIDVILAQTKRGELSRGDRIFWIDVLMEKYFFEQGEMPDSMAMEKLTDLILHEELTDMNPHKVSQTEYSFLSEHQSNHRGSKELLIGKSLDMIASDGQSHDKPVRRERSWYENSLIDKMSDSGSKERNRAYTEFIKVQPVFMRNLRDVSEMGAE